MRACVLRLAPSAPRPLSRAPSSLPQFCFVRRHKRAKPAAAAPKLPGDMVRWVEGAFSALSLHFLSICCLCNPPWASLYHSGLKLLNFVFRQSAPEPSKPPFSAAPKHCAKKKVSKSLRISYAASVNPYHLTSR